jgi:hypothetical protein
VKIAVFQFYLQSGKQKNRVGGDDNYVGCGKKFCGEKGSVRQVPGEVFAHFHAVCKMSQWYEELTVWIAGTNSL